MINNKEPGSLTKSVASISELKTELRKKSCVHGAWIGWKKIGKSVHTTQGSVDSDFHEMFLSLG